MDGGVSYDAPDGFSIEEQPETVAPMNLRRSRTLLAVFAAAWGFFMFVLSDKAAALLAAMFTTVLLRAISTREMNIGRGIVRMVGPKDAWYWIFLVLLTSGLVAVLVAAPKRNLRNWATTITGPSRK